MKQPENQMSIFETSEELKEMDLFEMFLKRFNNIRKEYKKKARFLNPTTKSVRERFREVIKAGYTLDDMENVIRNVFRDKFHMKNGFKWVTPDYILRDNTIQRYVDVEEVKETTDNDFGYDY